MSNELVKVSEYQMTAKGEEVLGVLKANLAGGSVAPFDLDRVKVPSGGITTWTVPGLDGDEDAKEITGIVVAFQDKRTFWEIPYDERDGDVPPDCYSDDMEIGNGTPGGDCPSCPNAKFGSKGKGQACSQRRWLYVVRENNILPLIIDLAPTSVPVAKKFFQRMASQLVIFYGLEIKLELEATKNTTGTKYSILKISKVRTLDDDTRKGVEQYIESIAPQISNIRTSKVYEKAAV